MNKRRRAIYDKSGGLCWYCGITLPEKGWHADHFFPIRRNPGDPSSMLMPEYDTDANLVPSCASCNNLKGSYDVEFFRVLIQNFIASLNKYSTQYKIAKRYDLIEEKPKPVIFWYETHIPNFAETLKRHLHKGEGKIV